MAENEKLYKGLFAILNQDDDTTVDYLIFDDGTTFIKRVDGDWVFLEAEDEERLVGLMVPVIDDFIPVFDEAQKTGKTLVESDTDDYLRELEPWE
jgi:hypothetical protein